MTCHKLAFRTPEQAERTAEIIQRQGLRSAETMPVRLYLCPDCGLWHWTSQEHGPDESVKVVPFRLASPPREPEPEPEPQAAAPGPRASEKLNRIRKLEMDLEHVQKTLIGVQAREAKRRDQLEATIAWFKTQLHKAVGSFVADPTPESVANLAAVANAVASFRCRADPRNAEALAEYEANVRAKAAWLLTRD